MKIKFIAAFLGLMLGFTNFALASTNAAPDEAKSMAVKAAGYLEQHGVDASFEAFMAPGGDWHDRDLYVFVIKNDGTMVAHGAKASLVGRNVMSLKDVDGKAFVAEFLKVQGEDWIDYKWQNPQSKAVENKTSYIVRVGEMVVGVGAYR
jgi:signal transduction histidine kinase